MNEWLKNQLNTQGITQLTTIQNETLAAGIADGESMVVCAPTSSGKTLVGEFAMLSGLKANSLTLYLVSHKALADQKFDEFTIKYGSKGVNNVARIAISTADRDEGDVEPQILVATYEKALSLVMSDSISVGNTIIVADELQIIGEDKRGPEIEILCAALRRRKPKQFVALTATIENGEDISGWLECKLVQTSIRDVELIQEVWFQNQIYTHRFGDNDGIAINADFRLPTNTMDAVHLLLEQNRGPVLVFVETRRDAMELAHGFSTNRSKTPTGYNFSEQLSLFSEVTEFSDQLKASAETKVVFHTADLTPSERGVVEQGLITSNFDVCFATPTLAAGVNFPFRTVVFDRIRRRYIPPPLLPLGSYRNMSGRAGRLGMHDKGYCIMLPKDQEELEHANILVKPENEKLFSKLASMSVRKIVLSLVASKVADSNESIKQFLEQTLFWYQVRDRNPAQLDKLVTNINDAVDWLIKHEMLVDRSAKIIATELGVATARSGLLPSTAYSFSKFLIAHGSAIEQDFESYELPLIHEVCCSDEFDSDNGQRFLPTVPRGVNHGEVWQALKGAPIFTNMNSAQQGANNAAFAIFLFITGEIERKIGARSGVPSGQVHRFATEISWILDGLHRLAGLPSLGCSQKLMNQIGILSQRVRLGVPIEVIDLIRTAQLARVPGFGRQRAVALLKAKLSDRDAILQADLKLLETLLNSKERVDKLIEAIEQSIPNQFEKSKRLHISDAKELGIDALVVTAYEKNGGDYEVPVEALLRLDQNWKITKLDDGKRQGVPDFMIEYKGLAVVLECKTAVKKPPIINKEDAFAVLTKATDISGVHRITLGKPEFDTFSQSKACGSSEVTLINHSTFIGAILLKQKGLITLDDLFSWMCEPGVAEFERLLSKQAQPNVSHTISG